jgi:putative hydrolase of the HAD superfamily
VKKYRVVLFDLFGTVALFQRDRLPLFAWQGKTLRSTMGALRATIERQVPAVPFERFFEVLSAVSEELGEMRAREMREFSSVYRFELALMRAGCPASAETYRLAEELSQAHMTLLASATEIPPAHVRLLARARAGYEMALVSNFDHAPTARLILDRDRAGEHFHQIMISEEHGWRKPHPKIFADTLATFDAEPQDALFVGDSPQDDLVGAKGVGMDVAWVNAQDVTLPAGIPAPDYTVRAIPELERVLFS